MKQLLKWLGIALAVIVLFLGVFAAYVNFKPLPTYSEIEIPELQIQATPDKIALGQKLVYQNCVGCHAPNNQKLEGGLFEDEAANEAFGNIYVPNITNHKVYGIGSYTDGEFYRLMRTGVKKDGKLMLPIMPRWVTAPDEDIHAMIAFLRSDDRMTEASAKQHPTYEPSFLAKGLLNFVFKPYAYQESYPQKPSPADSIAYGRYLTNNAYGCYLCHSKSLDAWDLENPVNTPNYLQGGTVFNSPEGSVVAPSLIVSDETDVGGWTIEQFVDAVKYGQRPNKPAYKKPMHPYNLLDTSEVRSIYHYLASYSESL